MAEPTTKTIDGKVFGYWRPGVYVYPAPVPTREVQAV